MPKELFEIKQFESGIITNPDDRDIPDNAAVYSENIDPYGQSGSLTGIHADASAIIANVDAKRMAIINDNNTHRLIYVDNSDGDIKSVEDLYAGSPSITTLKSGSFVSSGDIPAMQNNNKEVHVGLGKSQNAKWIGIIPNGQFGGSAPSGTQVENAELTAPSPFPNMHAVVNDATNTYVYGIQQNGNYVYKFDVSTGVLVRRSEYFFSETEAICLASDGNLWVADIASTNFTILKIDPDNMDVVTSRVVTGTTGVTDIMQCANTLWMARGNASTSQCLWNVSVSNLDTNASAISANTKYLYPGINQGSINTAQGDWSSNPSQRIQVDISTPKLPLIRVTGSNSYVGIATHVVPTDSGSYARFNYASGDDDFSGGGTNPGSSNIKGQIKWWCHVVRDTYPSATKMESFDNDGTVLAFSQDFTQAHNKVYLIKQDTNSTYLNWVEEGSSTSVSQLYRQNKLAYNHAKNTLIDNNRISIATNIDVEDAILDETSNSYNVFSGDGQIRWASGASGSLGIKAEGEVTLTFTVNNSVNGTLDTTKDHFYATSFTYDGYQESPLSSWELRNHSSDGTAALNVKINLFVSNLSKRVTHVNLYRSSTTIDTAIQPSGFFRLVKSISLKSGWLTTDLNTTNPDWGNYYSKTIIDSGISYASYESRTGISEAINVTLPKYGLSAKINNFLYISDCSHPDIEDASNYVFKSQAFNFDQFNWVRDFLVLPNKPTAIAGFNGRLFVFSENETYIANPDGMFIEDELSGIGCLHQNSVFVSELGMAWIDKNTIYYHNGKNIQDIGAPIKYANQIDDTYNKYITMEYLTKFDSALYNGDITVTYDGFRKAFYFLFTTKLGSGPITYRDSVLVYTIPKNRWDFWNRNSAVSVYASKQQYGAVIGKNNEVLVSDSTNGLIQPYDPKNATKNAVWEWYSKKFTMGDSTADKIFYKTEVLSEDSTPTLSVNTTEDSSLYTFLNTQKKARHCQIRIANNDSTSIVDALRIVFRRLRRTKTMT